MDPVNYETPLAQYGSPSCPNAPNACYCTGKCTINYVYGVNMQRQAPPVAEPISAAHAAKIKEIMDRNSAISVADSTVRFRKQQAAAQPISAPSFVEEHNEQKDVTPNCSTREYQRPEDLTPNAAQSELDDIQRTIGADARSNSAHERALLQARINSGELAPGLNAGRIVMPKEAQAIDSEAVRTLIAENVNDNAVFFPLKEVLTGLEDILRYKNKKYGGTGLSNTGTFSKAPALEKLLARADDKIARIQNSSELQKNDIIDLAGYLILICANQGWNNFSEFQD